MKSLILSLLVFVVIIVSNVQAEISLENAFLNPNDDAKPWVYWYWMNGNISEDGIKADLEAMQDIGIGGVLLFDIGIHPAGPVKNRSEQWYALVHTAVKEASKRNIKVSFHCPGWSASGGPWVTPELGMQELVWSETVINGPVNYSAALDKPHSRLDYYRDIAVIAFPTIDGDEIVVNSNNARFQNTKGEILADIDKLTDGDPDSAANLPGTIDITLDGYKTFQSVCLRAARANGDFSAELYGWNTDQNNYDKLCSFNSNTSGPFSSHIGAGSFDPVSTDKLRLVILGRDNVVLEELQICGGKRINNWTGKAGFGCKPTVWQTTGDIKERDIVKFDNIIDITDKFDAAGRLNWKVPSGKWTVLRIGHTPTGINIFPAPHGGLGLECDKMSKEAVNYHYDHMQVPLLKMFGKELSQKALAYHHVDSYEAGWQNWTKTFAKEFRVRRGYDIRKYMVAITGRIIDNFDTTEEFLWDFRRTISDLFADNHYGQLAKRAHDDGLGFSTEPYGGGFESLQVGGRADHPMVEFWLPTNPLDNKVAFHGVSAARTYGRKIVSAEAFTSDMKDERWNGSPADFKALGDYIYCSGVNRFVIHVCPHQPYKDIHLRPGMTCGQNGIHMDRGNTWWSQSKAWVEYMTRCQAMLQEGLHVADVVYYQGDEAPLEIENRAPGISEGYDFDCCNTEILYTMAVKDGSVVLNNGKSYKYLVIPQNVRMTLKSLQYIEKLVNEGATVIGTKTLGSPSLSDYPHCSNAINIIHDRLWGESPASSGMRSVGNGRVIWGMSFESILEKDNLTADFDYTPKDDFKVHYTHRKTAKDDIYFIANAKKRSGWVNCRFRVAGKKPQFWYPDTGVIKDCAVYQQTGDVTEIPVYMEGTGSVFVIFKDIDSIKQAHITSVTKDGESIINKPATAETNSDVSDFNVAGTINNFTISLWAKPMDTITLPKQLSTGVNWADQDWAIFPAPGHVSYGQGHAGAGISIGQNGICVMEHSANLVASVLVYEFDNLVNNFINVSVVYKNGTSHLFINGKLVKTGLTTGLKIHPGKNTKYYQGYLSSVHIEEKALAVNELVKFAFNRPDFSVVSGCQLRTIEFDTNGNDITANVWQPGKYNLNISDGSNASFTVADAVAPVIADKKWEVYFPEGWGAPEKIELQKLKSISEHSDFGVKHFSGTATYKTVIDVPKDKISFEYGYYLDLGQVGVIAELTVNGKDFGILWKSPFAQDISSVIKPGKNKIEVKVTNLWVNRLIGDGYFPEDVTRNGDGSINRWPEWLIEGKDRPQPERLTFSAWRMWNKNDKMPSSGLIGPVQINICKKIQIKP